MQPRAAHPLRRAAFFAAFFAAAFLVAAFFGAAFFGAAFLARLGFAVGLAFAFGFGLAAVSLAGYLLKARREVKHA